MGSTPTRLIAAIQCCSKVFFLCVGPLLVLFALALVGFLAYTYFVLITPRVFPDNVVFQVLHYTATGFLVFNLLFNYMQCVLVNPGNPPRSKDDEDLSLMEAGDAPNSTRRTGKLRYCKKCKQYKPPRAHHCHICNKCILRMDHHCPWINNCVGFYNHKYFVLFMFYVVVCCVWISIVSSIPLFYQTARLPIHTHMNLLFSCIFGVAVSVSVGILLAWHIYLVLKAQTTIDFHQFSEEARDASSHGEVHCNPYDLGYRENFRNFFGTGRRLWTFFLPSIQPPPGNGITYPTIYGGYEKTV